MGGESKEKNNQNVLSHDSTVATIEGTLKEGREIEEKASVIFDDALAETKFGKFNYFIISISGLLITYALIETVGISYVLPVSQCDLNLTTKQKGVLSAVGFIGIITSSHLWGFLADTMGRRRVIRPTLFMSALFAALSSLSKNFWMLVVLRYITGFFASGGSATVYAYLGEFHTTKVRSRAIMGASFVYGITFGSIPAVAWLVINQDWSFYIPYLDITYKPWRLFLVVCGLPGLFCALCLLKIPESPKFVLSQGKEKETINILKTIYSMNTGKSKDEFKIESVKPDQDTIFIIPQVNVNKSNPVMTLLRSMWDQTAPLFMNDYLRQSTLICIIQFGIFATSNGLYMWFPGILNEVVKFIEVNGNKTNICDVIYSNFGNIVNNEEDTMVCNEQLESSTYQHAFSLEIMYIVGFSVMGFIINAVGKIPILVVVLVGCGICGIAINLVNLPLLAIYLYVVTLLCGLGTMVLNAATVDLYPTHLRAMSVCISLMMGRVGGVVGANIAGVLLDGNCEIAFVIFGSFLIACGLLGFLIPLPKKKKEKKRHDSMTIMSGNYLKKCTED